jgi:diketogulonate reductase-like aldo/keto reductase
MNTVALPDGTPLPSLGLGTWHLGESARNRALEVASVRLAIEIGYRVIDTAEMYGEGGAEEVVGRAVAEALRAGTSTREQLFIVSKVYPHNASRSGVVAACERSLKRLGLAHIDLYLLHWPGPHPLRETVAGFEALQTEGRIRHWGVSNFDTDEMRALSRIPGGDQCAANQVYHSLSARGAEFELLPWQRERSMPLMAYCPLDQGGLANEPALRQVGERHRSSASQIALAALMAQPGVMVIPKALREAHLRENFAAGELVLSAVDLDAIERRFPAPRRKTPLAML